MFVKTYLYCAICWNLTLFIYYIYFTKIEFKGLLITIYISLYFYIAYIVKILIEIYILYIHIRNQQITKSRFYKSLTGNIQKSSILSNNCNLQFKRYKSNLVGISETTRTKSLNKDLYIKPEHDKFNQWLAGLIDGDGYLGISKKGYTSCEITVALQDEKTLYLIKQRFGGSIKLRSGSKSVRYRLHNKIGMINLINAINGNIRNTKRLIQLHHVCTILNLPIIEPIKLTINNSWFSGFFDADGTIEYYYKNNRPQLTISVTNKLYIDIYHYLPILGGNIYYDRSQNGYYKWSIQSKSDILNFVNYIKNNPSRTVKLNRIILCKLYFDLINLKAFKPSDKSTNINKSWNKFEYKWNKKD